MKKSLHTSHVAVALALGIIGTHSVAQTSIPYKCICQNIGTSPQEQLGDREGHTIAVHSYSCRVEGGPLDGAVLTGMGVYDWDKTNAIGITGNGVGRKAGAVVVYQLGEFKNSLTMVDGKVTGFLGSGQGIYKLATGTAAALAGKTFSYTVRPAGFNQFVLDAKID